MNDENEIDDEGPRGTTYYSPFRESRIPKQTPGLYKNMTFEEMMVLGLVVGGAVVGSTVTGVVIGWVTGSVFGFTTGAWWGRRSTKSK